LGAISSQELQSLVLADCFCDEMEDSDIFDGLDELIADLLNDSQENAQWSPTSTPAFGMMRLNSSCQLHCLFIVFRSALSFLHRLGSFCVHSHDERKWNKLYSENQYLQTQDKTKAFCTPIIESRTTKTAFEGLSCIREV
jgi:hypothetical protein